jgi:hypothetical protein
VFKGLSVLIGVVVSLGSTGLVTQMMSGLVIVYSRALRKGDYVRVNDVEGMVSEVGAFATKIVTMRNEEVTIPNAVLTGNAMHNFSKLAGADGTLISTKVTIGYDAPWRQVHALLEGAAARTPGLRTSPKPVVYQLALSDFYAEYELFTHIDNPLTRVATLSTLHANIQTVQRARRADTVAALRAATEERGRGAAGRWTCRRQTLRRSRLLVNGVRAVYWQSRPANRGDRTRQYWSSDPIWRRTSAGCRG